MGDIIQLENKFYISVNSTYADDRVRVLNHIDSFGIFDRWGDIKQLGEEVQGIYHNGMRYISELQLRINGKRPLLLSSSVKEKNEILSVDLTNPILQGEDRTIQKDEIYLGRSKFIRNGSCYERIRLNNYGTEFCKFNLSIEFGADFKDIFEVRGMTREKRGEITEIRHLPDAKLSISYLGLDGVTRITQICFENKPDSWENHSKALYNIEMPPHDEQYIEYTIQFLTEDESPQYMKFLEAQDKLNNELEDATKIIAKLTASNDQLNQWIERSQHDLISLLADTAYGKYPYAGVPWYNTAFGRDGIITALETLWVAPDIARDVLRYLAHTQATEINTYQDAEPGKIIHEVRGGEMVAMNEIPFKRYYGSVDSTPLFIMLAGAYYTRTADESFVREIWPNIKAALEWIDTYGDINGDGFIEYQHKSVNGLTNQGWKDSHDSIMYENGNLAESPIAPCEVQGYVYDAKIQAAKLARLLNDNELADKLDHQAATLKKRFNEVFWDEELSCYVLALDGKGKPCRVVSSNAGHTLFTSIADKDKAKKLVERLFQPDMFNGWGIRTLGKNEKRYNPMSYHNGSVWPHDVSLIARGLSKYGYTEETLKLATSLFDASLFIELQRLPELFCGFDRRKGEGPTNYPVACSPQAWAVATVYMLLESCLHIDIYAEQKKVYFYNPVIPVGTEEIFIHQLKLGDGYADLELYTENGTVGVKIKTCPPGWQVFIVTEKTVGNMHQEERQYA
ncbi:MAG TPA: amylo-alpha-1,6-glucosidase [Chitinophagaceae bacterium]